MLLIAARIRLRHRDLAYHYKYSVLLSRYAAGAHRIIHISQTLQDHHQFKRQL
jgi:hypothetical protein